MYYNKNNKYFHGIMFHHFHDNIIHKKGQGSINKDDLYNMIKFIGRKNILDAEEFLQKFSENKLKKKDVCLTFDDGIKCQFDVAVPVLEDLKIKGFFFPQTSVFQSKSDSIEIYRYFRINYFRNINDFYKKFFKKIHKNLDIFLEGRKELMKSIKKKFPFYTSNDIKFRVIRNEVLKPDGYKKVMHEMFEEKKFIPSKYYNILFMNTLDIVKIKKLGHSIGLHTHRHPTNLEKLDYKEQFAEYKKNLNFLLKILNCNKGDINCMSHPYGSYNKITLRVLRKLGIKLGFKQSMAVEKEKKMKKINNSNLEIARQDHSNIMRMMKKNFTY